MNYKQLLRNITSNIFMTFLHLFDYRPTFPSPYTNPNPNWLRNINMYNWTSITLNVAWKNNQYRFTQWRGRCWKEHWINCDVCLFSEKHIMMDNECIIVFRFNFQNLLVKVKGILWAMFNLLFKNYKTFNKAIFQLKETKPLTRSWGCASQMYKGANSDFYVLSVYLFS